MKTTARATRPFVVAVSAIVVALIAAGCVSPGPPFNTDPGLAANGYTERQLFLTGTATAYGMAAPFGSDGRWSVEPTTHAYYRTRLWVRRPVDPSRFNGTVLVEWLNVSSGFDIDVTFGAAIEELVRDGYAYVGVSAQKRGVDNLKGDPNRWGTLQHPGDEYSYDIFSQAGAAVRGTLGTEVLGGLHPQKLLAAGESQSASRFVTYINAIQPVSKVYDGFIVYSRGSGAAPLFPDAQMPQPSFFRTDQPEPGLDVQTAGDIDVLRAPLARQHDSSRFRLWEVAGGSHADEHTLSRRNPPSPTGPNAPCVERANSASTFAVVSAAVSALAAWVDHHPPPSAPRITLGPDPSATDPVVRDEFGNAEGGIRLPELEVPIATINGLPNPAPPEAPPIFQTFCRTFGQTIEFSDEQLDDLYPTHEAYVDAFDRATDAVVAQGFVLPEEGLIFKVVAAASDIGR
jgi:hypothetical protein